MKPFVFTWIRVCSALVPAALAACGASDLGGAPCPQPTPAASASAAPMPSFVPAIVAPPQVTEGAVKKITARADIPLDGPRVDGKPGDYLLENGGNVAVISAEGRVLDVGPRGGRDEVTAIDPSLFVGFEGMHYELESIAPFAENRGIHVVRRALERPFLLHVFISFAGSILRVESAAVASSPKAAALTVTLGERVGWGNVPTWVEGQGFVENGRVNGEFLARESLGVAYALCAHSGKLHARIVTGEAGFFGSAVTGEASTIAALDAPTPRRIVEIASSTRSLGHAAMELSCTRRGGVEKVKIPEGLPKEAKVEAARCPDRGKSPRPFARFSAEDPEIVLPRGCNQMRLGAPGHGKGAWFQSTAWAGRTLPPAATLRFEVDEKGGGAIPARVLVRGIKGTADPDWGDDPVEGTALNVIHADKGRGERPIPPGTYKVSIHRGFEFTAVEKEITAVAGRVVEVRAELSRAVDTTGWISADLHLHAVPSPDAPQPLADRVRALAASGVEVAVATDHNKVTDYKETITSLGLTQKLASIVGDEVTTRDPPLGHFNVFPLPPSAAPIPWAGVSPKGLFDAARAAGAGIVQVNHPRMGDIGYFELLRLDPEDVGGWMKRAPFASWEFDALEVYNGDHYALIHKVEECLRDYYAILDSGKRVTATGNSDSHKLSFHEPGVPRNFVAVPSDDPARFDEKAFIEAVKKGKVMVSGGPFVRLTAGGKGIGESVAPGEIEVEVIVDAPPWIDVDRVDVLKRGEIVKTFRAPFGKGPHRVEERFRESFAKGDYITAIARGSKPMTYLYRSNARPFSFTNPIWVE